MTCSYHEIIQIENKSADEFKKVEDDFAEFVEDNLCGDEYGIYEYDGEQDDDEYLIQINDDEDDWKENFERVIEKIIEYLKKEEIEFKKLNNEHKNIRNI